MLAAVEDLSELHNSGPVPALLPPWRENPYRLVTLWDVLYFNADSFVNLMSDLEEIERALTVAPQKMHDPIESKRMANHFAHAIAYCGQLGLSSALKQAKRIRTRIDTGACAVSEFKGMLLEFRTRILEDCQSKVFFSITDSRIIDEFFESAPNDPEHLVQKSADKIFDPSTVARFPGIIQDTEEAARCFVCGRHSACVFHLMRVVEVGVLRVALVAGITDQKPSWGAILQKVEKLVFRTEYKDLPSVVQPNIAFLKDVLPRLQAVQHAWRNKVTHVEDKLIPTTAEANEEICWEVLIATRALMRKLASDVPAGF